MGTGLGFLAHGGRLCRLGAAAAARSRDVDYDNRPISGHVDVEFDIGPSYYNFVDVRYIGEPVLRERIVESSLNITYISHTVNVTNITYTNSRVYNYGPDYDTVSRYSTRPIRRMTLEHDANVDLSVAVRSKGAHQSAGRQTHRRRAAHLPETSQADRPEDGEGKNRQTDLRAWMGRDSDPKAQAELKEKMKSEDPKKVPPPSIKPRDGAETAQSPAGASPAAPASGIHARCCYQPGGCEQSGLDGDSGDGGESCARRP